LMGVSAAVPESSSCQWRATGDTTRLRSDTTWRRGCSTRPGIHLSGVRDAAGGSINPS
jgi:hypothetical protein